jgi:hypothetical protein
VQPRSCKWIRDADHAALCMPTLRLGSGPYVRRLSYECGPLSQAILEPSNPPSAPASPVRAAFHCAASLEARARHTDFSARIRTLPPRTSRGASLCPSSACCDAREYASAEKLGREICADG